MKDTLLLPADNYVVVNKTIITEDDKKNLSMLYQPIIGPLPVMLYYILCNDLDSTMTLSNILCHHHLITNLHCTCEELQMARNKLEAIGLIKTYFRKDNVNNYIYELYSPLSIKDFLSDPILNVVLYNNLGKKEYDRLVSSYKLPKINKDNYHEITHTFNEVFDSIPYTSFEVVSDNIRKYNKLKLNIDSSFDINFLIEGLPNHIDKNKIFTESNRELIISLSYLYDIDASKMKDILVQAINEKGLLSKDDLRKLVRNYYQFDHGGILPTIIEHTQPEYLRKPVGDNSKLSKMIYFFETTSPKDLLKSRSGNNEPVKRDIKLLEDLIIDYGLKPGVVNVLIDYVLKTNNNKLNRSLVETIAGQWQRNKIETVEDAINLARREHKKYSKNNITKPTKDSKITPEWFDKEVLKEDIDNEMQQELEEMLKEYQ